MEQDRSDMSLPIYDLPQYRNRTRVFRDRYEAIEALAELFPAKLLHGNPILVATTSAGYLLANGLAERFDLDLDFAPIEGIPLPWNQETDYAAVAFDGTVYLDHEMVEHNRLAQREIDKGIDRALKALRNRPVQVESTSLLGIQHRKVLLVDESISTAAVTCAAVKALRVYGIKMFSLLVATAHDKALVKLATAVHSIYCANLRSGHSYTADDLYKQSIISHMESPVVSSDALLHGLL